jgi:hypothetical protein
VQGFWSGLEVQQLLLKVVQHVPAQLVLITMQEDV